MSLSVEQEAASALSVILDPYYCVRCESNVGIGSSRGEDWCSVCWKPRLSLATQLREAVGVLAETIRLLSGGRDANWDRAEDNEREIRRLQAVIRDHWSPSQAEEILAAKEKGRPMSAPAPPTYPIKEVVIRPNSIGLGWFIVVEDTKGNKYPSDNIIDPTILVAEMARIGTKLALKREVG